MFKYLLIILALAYTLAATAQQPGCGTAPPTPAQIKYIKEILIPFEKNTRARTTTDIRYFPIRPVIIRKTDGTGTGTELEIMQGLAKANRKFIAAGIQFYIAGAFTYINDDALFNFEPARDNALTAKDTPNLINIYYTYKIINAGQEIGGYTFLPGGPLHIVLDIGLAADANTLPHELGHFFNLSHTFHNNNAVTVADRELVRRTNCSTSGDFICDTPADPYDLPNAKVTSCVYAGEIRDANGDLFTPALDNVMSYYFCGDNLTPNQYTRINSAAQLNRATLNFTGTSPSAPTNLLAAKAADGIQLNWQDNANTETGFFIERSTDLTADFVPIAAVGADQVSFIDKSVAAHTAYYYRIKPTNAKEAFSNVSTVVSGFTYCEPIYNLANCKPDDGAFINEFVLRENTTEIFANRQSGCSGYSNFTSKTATVTVGKTYNFNVKLNLLPGDSYYEQKIGIWADLNKDGDFEDSGEVLYQSTSGPYNHTGTFTIPVTASAGTTRLRIRSVADQNINKVDRPCAAYAFGEAEDYTLQVVPTCATYTASATVGQPAICAGEATNLTAAPGATSYVWSPATGLSNANIANPIATPTQTTTYTVTATLNGCQKTANVTVTVNPLPAVSLGIFSPVCSTNAAFTLTGGAPAGGIYSGPGVSNGVFNAVTAGMGTHTISYTYTNSNNCTATATQTITVSTCNGIRESALEAALMVYPNPTDGLVQITLPVIGKQDVTIRVQNSQGQTVTETTHKQVRGEINTNFNLRAQAKGLYFIQLLTENEVVTKKIILK